LKHVRSGWSEKEYRKAGHGCNRGGSCGGSASSYNGLYDKESHPDLCLLHNSKLSGNVGLYGADSDRFGLELSVFPAARDGLRNRYPDIGVDTTAAHIHPGAIIQRSALQCLWESEQLRQLLSGIIATTLVSICGALQVNLRLFPEFPQYLITIIIW